MVLGEAAEGQTVKIHTIMDKLLIHRLHSMGIVPGTTVQIIKNNRKWAVIIQVEGARLAVGRTAARFIEVVPVGEIECRK